MRNVRDLFFVIISFISVLPALTGCSGNSHTTVFVEWSNRYYTLEELAEAADLIVVGTVTDTEKGDNSKTMPFTLSTIEPELIVKGEPEQEIKVWQTGAAGWGEESGNPLFVKGERCFLFLRCQNSGSYGLLNPAGRFRIEDNKVSSLNYILPTGEADTPQGLMFWNIELEDFIGKVGKALEAGPVIIPVNPPVIRMELTRVMCGTNDTLSVYPGGKVIYIKEQGLRFSTPDNPPVRSWHTGEIPEETLTKLDGLFHSEAFALLKDTNVTENLTDNITWIKAVTTGDMQCEFDINYAGVHKKVITSFFTTPDRGLTYPSMPEPLDEIYRILRDLGENGTEEVLSETIGTDAEIEIRVEDA